MKIFFFLIFFFYPYQAHAVEIAGSVGLGTTSFKTKPTGYKDSSNRLDWSLLGHFEFSQTDWELGLIHTGARLTYTSQSEEHVSESGFWLLPVLYRASLYAPFFSFALGPDFGIASNPAGGFKNHFGLELALEGVQEIGDHFGITGNIRIREALGSPFTLNSQTSGLRFMVLSLGIQKRLE